MSTDVLYKLSGYIKAAGYHPRPYSGRDMFGAHCLAFSVDEPVFVAMLRIVVAVGERLPNGLPEIIGVLANATIDSLGMGSIVYWPEHRLMSLSEVAALAKEKGLEFTENELVDRLKDDGVKAILTTKKERPS